MSACHKVFDIFELAENIFANLTTRDLLCGVQQTSKHFQAIIENSTLLQQALFIKPVAVGPLTCDDESACWKNQAVTAHLVCQHPVISRIWNDSQYDDWFTQSFDMPTARWRRCFITQPPAT
jgi:hypothetical protein